MEQTEENVILLNQLQSPAFFVSGGVVTHVNTAAGQRMISPGTPINQLLATGHTEYSEFCRGCLYLTLNLCGICVSASVTRANSFDLFVLEQEDDTAELQAMALAAQQLRSPLSNVMAVAGRLFPIACLDENPAAQNQIARINRGLFQMLRIVSNMSDAYRYSQGTGFHAEVRDICSFFEEILSKNAALMHHADVNLCYTLPHDAIFCLADSEKLERAVSNILSNALKFCKKGSIIEAKLVRRGNLLFLTVQNEADTDYSSRGNVYEQFRREPGIEDGRFGLGLGMVLIRSAAAAHGGTVLMEQNADLGTRITMTMAIQESSSSQVRSPVFYLDYAGEWDHSLIELSESLPPALYGQENLNG